MKRLLLLLAVLVGLCAAAQPPGLGPRSFGPNPLIGTLTGHRLSTRPGASAPTAVFVASAATSSSSGTLTCNVPAGTQNGDLILAYIVNNSTTAFSNNTAWNGVKNVTSGSLYASLQARFASSEPASYTWTGLGTSSECITRSYRNVAMATPYDDVLTSGSSGASVTSQATAALIATVNPNELNVNFWANNNAQAITGPGGLINIKADNAQLGVYSGDVLLTAGGTVAAAKTATVSAGTQMSAIAVNLLGTSSPVPGTFAFSVTSPSINQTISGASSSYIGQAGTKWAGGVNLFYSSSSTPQPISFVGDGGYSNSATSPLAMTLPPSCGNGNLMVMVTSVTSLSATSSITTPSGWTYLTDVNGSVGSPGYFDHFYVFYKYFSADGTTASVSGSAASGFAGLDGVTRCFKNVASPSPINSFKTISTAVGQVVTIPALTETFKAGELYFAAEISLRNNFVGPNGFNPTVSDYFDNTGNQDGYSLGDYLPSGTPGPMAMTVTGTIFSPVDEQGIGISILPATAASGLIKLLPNNVSASGGSFSGNFDSTVLPNGQVTLQAIAFSADGTPSAPIPLSVVIVNNSGITFVGSGFAGVNGAGTCSVNVPTGTSVGDVMLGYAVTSAAGPGATPAGWTLSRTAVNGSQSATLYWKVASGGDLGTALNFTGLSSSECAIRSYHGVYTGASSPIDATAQCVAGSATTCPVSGLPQTASSAEVQVGFWDFNNPSPAPTCPGIFGNVIAISGQRGLCMGDLVLGLQGVTPASQTASTGAGAGGVDSINATLLSGPPAVTPATITTPPVGQTVSSGQPATFTVVAAGSPPLAYQWHYTPKAGGDNVVGSNQASYTTGALTTANTGDSVYVIVSNSGGSASSSGSPAVITVTSGTSTTFNAVWTNLPNPPSSPNNTKAVPALAFNLSIGANACGHAGGSLSGGCPPCGASCVGSSGSISGDVAIIHYIGLGHLRIGNGDPTYATSLATTAGVKIIGIIDTFDVNTNLGWWEQMKAGGVLAVAEGLNEPPSTGSPFFPWDSLACAGGSDWHGCAEFQKQMQTAIRADANLNGIPWTTVTLNGGEVGNFGMQYAVAGIPPSAIGVQGCCSGYAAGTKFDNIMAQHTYSEEGAESGNCPCSPNHNWDLYRATGGSGAVNLDFVNTWGSHYSGLTQTQTADVLNFPRISTEWDTTSNPEEYHASSVVAVYIEAFSEGYSFMSRWGIIETPDNKQTNGAARREGFYCNPSDVLFQCSTLTPYPSADYVHSLTHFMADTGDVVSPGTVNWSWTSGCGTGGANNDSLCHGLLLQKSASAVWAPNSYDLLVVYEPNDGGPTISPNISLGQNFSHVNVYDATKVVTPAQNAPSSPVVLMSCANCSSITLTNWGPSMNGHSGAFPPPLIVELIP